MRYVHKYGKWIIFKTLLDFYFELEYKFNKIKGGVKAVVWTDTFQFVFTVIGTTTIVVVGLMDAGGFLNVLKIADEGNRTQTFE